MQEEQLLDHDFIQRKQESIKRHRLAQQSDTTYRDYVRRTLVKEIFSLEHRLLLHYQGQVLATATLANLLEDLREFKEALHQVMLDDEIAEQHWKHHFALPFMNLTHNERKYLRCFSTRTALTELPRRTKSPVERARERKLSATGPESPAANEPVLARTLSRGDGSMLQFSVSRKEKQHPITAIFRLPENGKTKKNPPRDVSSALRAALTPTTVQQHREDEVDIFVKTSNANALVLLQRNRLREAQAVLEEAVAALDAHDVPQLRAVTYCNLSNLFRRCRKWRKAEHFLSSAMAIERSEFSGTPTLSTLANMCGLKLQQNDIEAAFAFSQELDNLLSINGKKVGRHVYAMCVHQVNECKAAKQDQNALVSSPDSVIALGDCSDLMLPQTRFDFILRRISNSRKSVRGATPSSDTDILFLVGSSHDPHGLEEATPDKENNKMESLLVQESIAGAIQDDNSGSSGVDNEAAMPIVENADADEGAADGLSNE